MTPNEFREKYERDKPIFTAWGLCVTELIRSRLADQLGGEGKLDDFLKVPAKPRVKDTTSLIGKAFYRNKPYSDPYTQITDKVGTRFVVLVSQHIKMIEEIIERDPSPWRHSKDRNYLEEREKDPMLFAYQSVHYVLYSNEQMFYNGISIPEDTPCEVQIRTLLQHAYSELSHDTIYKPHVRAIPAVHRALAKSMALMETVDGFFEDVHEIIQREVGKMDAIFTGLSRLYFSRIGSLSEVDEKTNLFLLDAFRPQIDDLSVDDVETFLNEKDFIAGYISERAGSDFLFSQPVVLLIYFLTELNRHITKESWPLPEQELWPFFSDLGFSSRTY